MKEFHFIHRFIFLLYFDPLRLLQYGATDIAAEEDPKSYSCMITESRNMSTRCKALSFTTPENFEDSSHTFAP